MKKKKMTICIDKERCKGCSLCVEICPAGTLELGETVNRRGLRSAAMKDPSKCTGCGLCALVCPDCAIKIEVKEL
jgi:2-oxoglutarate ferredoxin oxidoreductase subunit delta